MKPLAIDLYCGLGGWTHGLLAEGWDVIGFDIERHRYPARAVPEAGARKVAANGVDFNNPAGSDSRTRSFNYANQCALRDSPLTGGWAEYQAHLVIQDVLTLHGSQFRDADLIVASPPCQEFSYMAMPWTRAKAKIAEIEACPTQWLRLCALFDACFRIQAEACAASGRHIPLIVENVRGAQRWVGRSRWNFGSFHLWGDVPALMPMTKAMPMAWTSEEGDRENYEARSLNAKQAHLKGASDGWFKDGQRAGRLDSPGRLSRTNGKSSARKAASAMIAKIPLPLSTYIARTFKPDEATVRPIKRRQAYDRHG